MVTLREDETLKVIETPEYFRNIIPFAAYFALGSYDESREAEFWVTPVKEQDPEKEKQMLQQGHNSNVIPVIALHEAYPGHHVQLTLAKQNLNLDKATSIRHLYSNTMLIEGWALYCEQLMVEQGFLNKKEELMMLKNRLWRAVRVVVDIELHTGRMSYNEAVAFLVKKLDMPEEFAKKEVLRYTMSPTQPLSYEIGRRLINQLRDKQKTKLGKDFNLKEFHNAFLSKGSLPIKVIEQLAFNKPAEVLN